MELKEFKLFDRLCWAKDNLEPHQSDYRVVFEDNVDEPAKVLVPDPNWMACAMHGGILPPVWVYHELEKDEKTSGFKKHTRGYLLHETEPMPPMSEEEAIEYLIMKDIPNHIWLQQQQRKPLFVTHRRHLLLLMLQLLQNSKLHGILQHLVIHHTHR
jgi:hypothetical protein